VNNSTIAPAQGSVFDKHGFKDNKDKYGDEDSEENYEEVQGEEEEEDASTEEDESTAAYQVGRRNKNPQPTARKSLGKYLDPNLAISTMKKYHLCQKHWKVNIRERHSLCTHSNLPKVYLPRTTHKIFVCIFD
jgi:hypothetical protein